MTLSQSVLATLSYHDIFDYPLRLSQIHKFLIGKKASILAVEKTVRRLVKIGGIGEKGGYYFLPNRAAIVRVRRQRKKYSWPKFVRAVIFSKLLKIIPTVKMAAVSGALAMENSHRNDDIDLVIATSPNWLWTTRFLANLLLWPFKRSPRLRGQNVADRVCLNIFLDESSLTITTQNLYSAHEICQMQLLWDRDKTYSRFIDSNAWVSKFLPSWQPTLFSSSSERSDRIYGKFSALRPASRVAEGEPRFQRGEQAQGSNNIRQGNSSLIEIFLKKFQLWYMRSKITTEKIGDTQLFFHPQNREKWILNEYRQRLKKLRR